MKFKFPHPISLYRCIKDAMIPTGWWGRLEGAVGQGGGEVEQS